MINTLYTLFVLYYIGYCVFVMTDDTHTIYIQYTVGLYGQWLHLYTRMEYQSTYRPIYIL